jgi:hypothetical protein
VNARTPNDPAFENQLFIEGLQTGRPGWFLPRSHCSDLASNWLIGYQHCNSLWASDFRFAFGNLGCSI